MVVYPSFRPQVDRIGMAAAPSASPRPVTVVHHPRGYVVIVQLPCTLGSLVGLRFRRNPNDRGMKLSGRVGVRPTVGIGGAVRHRRVYSVVEFGLSFQLPAQAAMRTAMLKRLDVHRSVLIFTLRFNPSRV